MCAWQLLPSAMYRGTGLLTTHGGGRDGTTAGRTGAEPSRARRGRDTGVAITAVAFIVSAKGGGVAACWCVCVTSAADRDRASY